MNPVNVSIQSAEDLSIFSHPNTLPYIAAVHCYSLTEKQGISVTQSTRDLRVQSESNREAPCYQIDFRGLSAYGNITDTVRTTIRTMIDCSKNALFVNHTRAYGVDSVRQMLPVLTVDPASTKWFDRLGQGTAKQKNSKAGPSSPGLKKSTAGPSTPGSKKNSTAGPSMLAGSQGTKRKSAS